jgi:hypothetical protein
MGFLSSLFGVSDRTPKTSTVVQSSKLPTELAPFVTDVLGEAQTMYQANVERGYDPYTGETIAGFTPMEEQSMEGLEGLAGTSKPYLDEALSTYRQGGEQFTGDTAQQYMSPYQQAVTDIELREAQRNFEGKTMPALEAQAINMGGMSGLGSRAGIEMAEAQRSQNQLLSDIQARGSAAAYQDARKGFEQQKAREQQMAGNIGRTGNAILSSGLQEQGILQSVGEQQRGLGQAVLDESYGKFLEEKNFPKQTLADYSNTIYGSAPSFKNSSTNETKSTFQGAPSMGHQLLGLGMAGLNSFNSGTLGKIGKGIGNFFNKEGGPVIPAQTGLSIQEQIKGLNQNYNKALNVKNVQEGVLTPGTAAYKRRADIKQSRNFLRGIEGEDEVKIQQAMKNQFKNFPPDQARKLAMDTLQAYTPSQLKGGRGTTNPPLTRPTTGLAGLVTQPNTTVAGKKPTASQPQPNNADMVNVTDRDLQRANKRFQNTISVLGMGDTISGGTLQGVKIPNINKERSKIATEVSQDPRFNVDTIRKRNANAIKQTVGELRNNIENREGIQEAGYEEESGLMDTFLTDQVESIKEDGATTSDIMAEAIDQGMKEPTIVTMLTKVLNTNEKGVQKRAREVRKELRDLKKQEFIIRKEDRKGKRTDKLANAQLKSEASLKKIAMQLGMEKELELLPAKKKAEIARQLAENIKTRGSVIKNVKDVYSIAGAILKEAGSGKTTGAGSKSKSMIGFIDTIRKNMNDGKKYILGKNKQTGVDEIQTPSGVALTQPQAEAYTAEFNRRSKLFTDRLRTLDPTMSNYNVMNMAYADTQTTNTGAGTGGGGQAGSNQNNPINPTNMTQAQLNSLPSGTFIRVPDPNNLGQFIIQKTP